MRIKLKVDCDEAVAGTAPLFRQLLTASAEESATEVIVLFLFLSNRLVSQSNKIYVALLGCNLLFGGGSETGCDRL